MYLSVNKALTCDGAVDLGAILQFNGNSLMTELHQKPEVGVDRTLVFNYMYLT